MMQDLFAQSQSTISANRRHCCRGRISSRLPNGARSRISSVKLLAELNRHWDHKRLDAIRACRNRLKTRWANSRIRTNCRVGSKPITIYLSVWRKTDGKANRARRDPTGRGETDEMAARMTVGFPMVAGPPSAFARFRKFLSEINWPAKRKARANIARHMRKFLFKTSRRCREWPVQPERKSFMIAKSTRATFTNCASIFDA